MGTDKKYCMCCDEEVSYNIINREGNRELACEFCGFVLEVVKQDIEMDIAEEGPSKPVAPDEAYEPQAQEDPADPVAPDEAYEPQSEEHQSEPKESKSSNGTCIITADDSDLIRALLKAFLEESKIADEITAHSDGQQAVTLISKKFSDGSPVDCIILDIDMPVMNGISAARIIRSLENRFHISPPTPIIFFSSLRCNPDLKEKLSLFSPAIYINKGKGNSPDYLFSRVKKLIGFLLQNR